MRATLVFGMLLIACGGSSPAQENTAGRPEDTARPAVYAGRFYPSDPRALEGMVDSLLALSIADGPDHDIIAGVVPHAGYVYSGATAADFYRSIEGMDFDAVILVGPAHQVSFTGFSVYDGSAYTTPLGRVPVAEDIARRLRDSHPAASFHSRAHEAEHCLEVHLPFLQKVLEPGFGIVPVLTGGAEPDALRYMAELLLSEACESRVLVIASSDLSHYPPLELAEEFDSMTVTAILEGDMEDFLDATSPERLPSASGTFACGRLPIALVMAYTGLYPEVNTELLSMTTSAEYSGDDARVVGYASISFASSSSRPSSWSVSPQGMEVLMRIAENSVRAAVTGSDYSPPDTLPEELTLPRGVFVTLTRNGQLRGCIGTLRPSGQLAMNVARMSASAALNDPRFVPVAEAELSELEYEISVLTPMQVMQDWRDVRVGTDGLLVIGRDGRSGVLLPQVPVEQGWNRQEYLEGVCMKAGLDPDAYRGDVILYRFQAQVFGEDGYSPPATD